MTSEQFLYLLPYLISFVLSISILFFTVLRGKVKGAREFSWFLVGQNLWQASLLLSLISINYSAKVFWDKAEWMVTIVSLIAVVFFVCRFTDFTPHHWKMWLGLFLIIPTLFVVFILTEPWHQFMYVSPGIVEGQPYLDISHTYTWPPMLYAFYCGLVCMVCTVFIISHGLRGNTLFRSQTLVIAFGVMLPVIGTLLSAMSVKIFQNYDPGAFTITFGGLIISWGLFRVHLFDIVPTAREKIFETMDDMVIVLDADDRIVDINKRSLAELHLTNRDAIGHSAFKILAKWPHLLEKFKVPKNVTTEVIFDDDSGYYHFDIKSTLVTDSLGQYMGRIFVARDVTKYAELQWRLRELNENLEKRVAEQTRQLAESYETTLEGWAKALEMRDKETEGHSRRVVEKTVELARAYGIPESEIDHIRRGAILHDIGKMAIPDAILREKKNLSSEDWEIIKKHPVTAYELLRKIPYLQPAIDIPYCHHEHWNGSGYPRGLRGKQIPLAARLFSVVDVWDALLSNRTYSNAWERENVIKYIKEKSGTEFDPSVVRVFLKLVG
jgi:putative nucleotidyltransferase with HDIG domain